LIDIAKVLQKIRPGAIWSINNNDYKTIVWNHDSKKPTKKEIEEAWEEISRDIELEKIKNLRKAAYREESDPLFFKYQRGEAEKSVWLEKVEEIKNRYPLTGFSQE
jgi:hypothetical protein